MVYENNKTTNNSSITIINNNTSKTDYHALTIKFNKRNANKKADHENRSQSYKSHCFDENFLLLQMSMSSNNIEVPQNDDVNQSNQRFEENCRLTTIEEESFTCPQCFRTYRRHGTLRRHLRQECGKGKSMVCSVCGHRTKRADHLRQHVRKKHPDVAMRSTFRQVSIEPTLAPTNTLPLYSTASTVIAGSTQSNTNHGLDQELERSEMKTVTTSESVNKVNDSNIFKLHDDDNDDDDDMTVDNDAASDNLFVESGSIDQKYKDVFRATLFQHLQHLEQNSKTLHISNNI